MRQIKEQVARVQLVHERLTEVFTSLGGVEKAVADLEPALNELTSQGGDYRKRLYELDARLDAHDKKLVELARDMRRAEEALPEQKDGQGGPSPMKNEVTTTHNESQSFWPDSAAPPQTLPPIGSALNPEPSAGLSATVPDIKNDGAPLW